MHVCAFYLLLPDNFGAGVVDGPGEVHRGVVWVGCADGIGNCDGTIIGNSCRVGSAVRGECGTPCGAEIGKVKAE